MEVNNELYKNSVEYEKLTQAVYQSILSQEGHEKIKVEHDINLKGRSDIEHQVDVYWQFKQASIIHSILIECKNYATALTLEQVRNFHAVLMDIGNCKGVMVTKVGYQKGAKKYADYYGIDLKLLRKPVEEDWKGKIKNIHINIRPKALVSTSEKPISLYLFLSPKNKEEENELERLQKEGKLNVPSDPEMYLLDEKAVPATEQMQFWLPKQLKVLDKENGGPYEQNIELKDKYILVNHGTSEERLIKVIGMKVKYWVEELDVHEIIIHGDNVVAAIMKDFSTNTTEYKLRKS